MVKTNSLRIPLPPAETAHVSVFQCVNHCVMLTTTYLIYSLDSCAFHDILNWNIDVFSSMFLRVGGSQLKHRLVKIAIGLCRARR